jgi:hypothetical protein
MNRISFKGTSKNALSQRERAFLEVPLNFN